VAATIKPGRRFSKDDTVYTFFQFDTDVQRHVLPHLPVEESKGKKVAVPTCVPLDSPLLSPILVTRVPTSMTHVATSVSTSVTRVTTFVFTSVTRITTSVSTSVACVPPRPPLPLPDHLFNPWNPVHTLTHHKHTHHKPFR
jgi:hypothetical protein